MSEHHQSGSETQSDADPSARESEIKKRSSWKGITRSLARYNLRAILLGASKSVSIVATHTHEHMPVTARFRTSCA